MPSLGVTMVGSAGGVGTIYVKNDGTGLLIDEGGATPWTEVPFSSQPVRYADGTAVLTATDLNSNFGGTSWGMTRSWTNGEGYAQENIVGHGMVVTQQPQLIQLDGNDDHLAIILSGHEARFFNLVSGSYVEVGLLGDQLEYSSSSHSFTLTTPSGDRLNIYDFSSTDPTKPAGKLSSLVSSFGDATTLSYNSEGQLASVARSTLVGSSTVDEEFVYKYLTTGVNAGLLKSVQLHRRDAGGDWWTVRKVVYSYYGNSDDNGNQGDLKTATIKDANDNALETTYYRYYTQADLDNSENGYLHGLKYVFTGKSFTRLDAAVSDPFTASDSAVAPYADHYFAYDTEHRVIHEDAQGAGCSGGGGLGSFNYSYTTSTNDPGANSWAVMTTETLPDGNQNIVYTNSFGQVMLKVYHDTTTDQEWASFQRYDASGHVILKANPSGVSGYDDDYADLVHYVSGNAEFLRDSDGLFTSFIYPTSTTASETTPGDVIGYLKETDIERGEIGTPIPQSSQTYIAHEGYGQTIYLDASDTVYPSDTTTSGALTTSYDYTFHTAVGSSETTLKIKQKTTTDPAGNVTSSVYDVFGNIIWTKDAAGIINYQAINQRTGVAFKTIVDVNTSHSDFSDLPPGWTTISGAGLHLVTRNQLDALGRPTKSTDANGNVTYTVYNDVDHESRVYRGWNTTTGKPTGPTLVIREDRDDNYAETLTTSATPSLDTSGRPTGTEAVTTSTLQSLSRNYFNSGGQLVATRDYFSFSGLTYSNSPSLGTEGTHYYLSQFEFDDGGRKNRAQRGDGTIYRTVFDGQGRVLSTWIGDDDTPTSGSWSPTNPAGMIRVALNEYDDGDVGDGLLTSVTDALGRVTSYSYDFRGRHTSTTLPDPDGSGSGHPLTSPVSYVAYDNLNRVTSTTDALGNETTIAYSLNTTSHTSTVTTTYPDPDGTGTGHPLTSPVTSQTYDGRDLLMSSTDALGNTTTNEYDGAGRLISTTLPDPDGAGSGHPLTSPVTSYGYDSNGNLTSTTDPLGNMTTKVYDRANRLTTLILADPDGSGSGHPLTSPQTIYAYDAAGGLYSVTDPLGKITYHEYDRLGRELVLTLPDPDGSGPLTSPTPQYAYDGANRKTAVTNPLGNVTSYTYNVFDQVLTATQPDPDGSGSGHPLTAPVTTNTYDNAGQLTSVTDPLGNVTSYAYDNLGRKLTVTAPDPDGTGSGHPLTSPVTTYAYDAMGNVTTVTDPLGHVTTNAYDNLYRLLSVTQPDPDGSGSLTSPVTTYAYDAAGHVTSVTDPLSHVTSYTYDNLGRKITIIAPDPDGSGSLAAPVTSYAYDAVGNQISATDPLGNVTTYEYDNLYRLMAVVQPDPDGSGSLISPETAYTYDAAGHRLTLRDPVGNVTTWYYDALGRVTGEVNYLDDARNFSYDAAGNLTQLLDRNDRVTAYVYDNLNRRIAEKWMDGTTVVRTISFTYDAASQLTAADDPDSEYAFTFDHLGRTLTVSNAGTSGVPTVMLTSAYDTNSRRTGLAAEIGSNDDLLNAYTYDDLGRLTRIEQTGQSGGNVVANKAVNYVYNANSRFTSITGQAKPSSTWNEVATSTFTYDALDRLTALDHKHSTTTIASYGWTFDVGSRITQLTGPDGTSDYSYDHTNQLVGADHSYQTDETYSYDENGNRTGGSYDTGDNNQLLSDNTYDYDYDAEGNRTLRTNRSSGAITEYTWDYRNRLTKVVERGSSSGAITKQTEFTYDLFNQRIKKSSDADGAGSGSAAVTRYVYDGQNPVLQFDGSGNLTHRYLDGPGIEPILADEAVTSLSSAGTLLWPLTDNLGTVRDLVNSSGSVQNHLKYDSFGKITNESASAVDFLFGYAAGIRDEETGLQYHHARYYDPINGRFISEDPKGFAAEDVNLGRYVANNPINARDPSGLEGEPNLLEYEMFGGLIDSTSGTVGVVIGGSVGLGNGMMADASFGPHVSQTDAAIVVTFGVGVGPYVGGNVNVGPVLTDAETVQQLAGWGNEASAGALAAAADGIWSSSYKGGGPMFSPGPGGGGFVCKTWSIAIGFNKNGPYLTEIRPEGDPFGPNGPPDNFYTPPPKYPGQP